jgi:hypothetical protein
MRHEINEDGAIPVAPPPGPLINADGLQGWGVWGRGRPHEPEEGGWTGRQPQPSREPSSRLPAEGHADGPQGVDQPPGVAGIGGGNVWQALGKDAARTRDVAAHKFPYEQLQMDSERAPGEVCQPALVVAMHRG